MALATTCPHCKTSFKVVADQLKLRRGLVRCGKCQEVFSGVDYLRYIDDPRPKPAIKPQAEPVADDPDNLKTAFFLQETLFNASVQASPMTIQAPVPVYIPSPETAPRAAGSEPPAMPADQMGPVALPSSAANDASSAQPAMDTPLAAATALAGTLQPSLTPSPSPSPSPSSSSSPLSVPASFVASADASAEVPTPYMPASPVEAAALKLSHLPQGLDIVTSPIQEPGAAQEQEPGRGQDGPASLRPDLSDNGIDAFDDHQAEHAALAAPARKRQGSRAVLIAVVLLAALALAQGIVLMRNDIAMQYPQLRSTLASLVEPLGLKVEIPRRFDALTIESFELQAAPASGTEIQTYFAQALLRNHASHSVQWPAIELSLTDPAGQLLARKVLLPADYLSGGDSKESGFAARSERNVRLRLNLNQLNPNGYSAVLFYP